MIETIPHEKLEISEDEVRFWLREVDASLKFQKDQFIERVGYKELVKYFEGIQKGRNEGIDTLLVLDEFSPGISSVISTAYYQNPSSSVKPLHPLAGKQVNPGMLFLLQNPDFQPFNLTDLLNSAMKHLMRKCGMKEEFQLATFDLLMAGFSVVEMNHHSAPVQQIMTQQSETVPQAPPQPQQGVMEQITGAVKEFVTDPLGNKQNNRTDEEVEKGVDAELVAQPVDFKDATYCRRWCPTEILFDSRARRFNESRFIGKIVNKSIAEYKGIYPDMKDHVPASDYMNDVEFGSNKQSQDKKSVRLYELEIKKKDGLYKLILGRGLTKHIDYYKVPVTTNGFTLKYGSLDKYGAIYPMPRAKKAKKSQDALNTLGTHMMEHVMRTNRKVAYFEGGLTDSGKRAAASSDIFALVEKTTPASVFERVPQDTTTTDNPVLQQVLKEAINKSIGTNEISKLGRSSNEFATQDALESQAFQTQVSQVQDALEDLANDVLDTGKDIVMQLWDGEEYFQITGQKGADAWYSPDMGPLSDLLLGDYVVEVNIVSAGKPNPLKDRSEAMELAKFLIETEPYANMKGKTYNMASIEAVIKSYDQNPDAIIEELQLMPAPDAPGQLPPPPGEIPPTGDGSVGEEPGGLPTGLGGLA